MTVADFLNVRLEGDKELLRAFKRLDKSMQRDVLVGAAVKGAIPMAARAKELAPRDTGELQDRGIQIKKTVRKRKYGEAAVTHRKNAAHAILQEYGVSRHVVKSRLGKPRVHPGHKAQPFFRPAFEQTKDQVTKIITADLSREILKAAR